MFVGNLIKDLKAFPMQLTCTCKWKVIKIF